MKKFLFSVLFCISCCTIAADLYPFDSMQKQKRFQHVLSELRCVVCQDENLASSNAEIAIQLRNNLFTMIEKNESNAAIKHYVTTRYGDYILLKPPFMQSTFILWMFPLMMLGAGVWIYRRAVRR